MVCAEIPYATAQGIISREPPTGKEQGIWRPEISAGVRDRRLYQTAVLATLAERLRDHDITGSLAATTIVPSRTTCYPPKPGVTLRIEEGRAETIGHRF